MPILRFVISLYIERFSRSHIVNSPLYGHLLTALAFASASILFISCGQQQSRDIEAADIRDLTVTESAAVDTTPAPPPLPVTRDEMLVYMDTSSYADSYAKGILPQMARDAPDYAAKLLASEHDGFLIVDKATMKLYRYDRYGVLQESVGIACSKHYGSKHKYRDNRTPEGFFSIEGIYDSTDWLYTDDDGNTSEVKGQFGPRFMRLKVPGTTQIGIHGTCAPWSIGGRRSHGCIRMTNENILRIVEIVKQGWPVIVSPGRKDMAVNIEEGYDIPSVAVLPGGKRVQPTQRPQISAETESPEHPDISEISQGSVEPETSADSETSGRTAESDNSDHTTPIETDKHTEQNPPQE